MKWRRQPAELFYANFFLVSNNNRISNFKRLFLIYSDDFFRITIFFYIFIEFYLKKGRYYERIDVRCIHIAILLFKKLKSIKEFFEIHLKYRFWFLTHKSSL